MSEEIKNTNQPAELNQDQLEDVAGGCGDMDYDYKKDKGHDKYDDKYKKDWKGDKYKGDWKGEGYKKY
jgi:hypothetical protein